MAAKFSSIDRAENAPVVTTARAAERTPKHRRKRPPDTADSRCYVITKDDIPALERALDKWEAEDREEARRAAGD